MSTMALSIAAFVSHCRSQRPTEPMFEQSMVTRKRGESVERASCRLEHVDWTSRTLRA